MNSENAAELTTTREFFHSKIFSAIPLLAAHVESSGVEELATPEGNEASRAGLKEILTTSEPDKSLISENAPPVVQSLHCDNENDTGVLIHVPSKDAQFHWNLNSVMDECEEPCFGSPPYTQGNCAEGNVDGGLQFQNLKKEGCGRREFDDMGDESDILAYDDLIEDPKDRGVVQGSVDDNITNHLTKSADPTTLVTKGHVTFVTDDNKLASEDTQYDCNGSEDFQDDQKHPADGDNTMKVQRDYDSPFEDGELRKPPAHALEENEVEKWETECVDFEFDDEYEDDFDTRDNAIPEKFVVDHDDSQALVKKSSLGEKNVDAVPGNDMIKRVKDASSKPSSLLGLKTPEGDQPGSGKNMFTVYTKMHRSVDVGELYSRTERIYGSEKMMGRDRLPFQGSARYEADYRWLDESTGGVRDSRNNYGYTRPRNVNGDSDGKASRLNSHDHSKSRSYGPWDLRRFINRRQSPTEKHDSYPLHRRTQPVLGFSQERSRGRSGFIPQGCRRAPQEEYHEPGPYYSGRKDRGFSPSFNTYSHIPRTHKRSRSRSRSMSPIAWNMDNRGRKRHSPEIWTEGRVQGERFPFQKRSFSGDFDQGIMSPRRLSARHNSRCFDDRKSMDGQYRERSSPPVRMFRQSPTFDSTGYPERLKSGDYFRQMIHPVRSPQKPGGHGPRNFDESCDDRKKTDERYRAMNRVRRYDTGAGGVRRFRYNDDDDCFEPRKRL